MNSVHQENQVACSKPWAGSISIMGSREDHHSVVAAIAGRKRGLLLPGSLASPAVGVAALVDGQGLCMPDSCKSAVVQVDQSRD
jgi:hypothetical protein